MNMFVRKYKFKLTYKCVMQSKTLLQSTDFF